MTEAFRTADGFGAEIDRVWVEIDYAILQHFSQHLYSSPNKAVEELVTNGYDALAHQVDVYLPGTAAEDCVLVWDDGESMDLEGLKHLWWIARSQKTGEERIATSADGRTSRAMIGKFGIGKLASYAVGNRLAHLCRRGSQYLLVSVYYGEAPQLSDDDAGSRSRLFDACPFVGRSNCAKLRTFALPQYAGRSGSTSRS